MPQKFTTDRPSWDEIRAARQPRTDSVWVPLDGEILEQIAQLEKAVAVAEKIDDTEHRLPEAPKLSAKLDELRQRAEEAAVQFTFVELTRRQFRALIEASPAKDPSWRWDEDTFAPLLLAASCSAPELTTIPRAEFIAKLQPGVKADDLAEFARPAFELWDEWSEAACYMLFGVAYEVNAQTATVPFSVTATGRTRASQTSSTSASEMDAPSDTTSS